MAANWGVIEERELDEFIAYHVVPMIDCDGEAVIRSIQAHRASLALSDGKPEIVDAEPIEDAEEDSDEDSEEEEDAE